MNLNDVITIDELSKILKVATSTIRGRIMNKKIPEKFYRKTESGSYIFYKKYVDYATKNK